MLRTFFSGLGVGFSAITIFCASFLWNVADGIDRERGLYAATAIDITRELSRTWKLSAIERRYTTEMQQDLSSMHYADPESLSDLGPLLHADNIRIEPRWSRIAATKRYSPAALAEILAALVGRSVTVAFIGRFAGGIADVSAELGREGEGIALRCLRVERRTPIHPADPPERRVISHA